MSSLKIRHSNLQNIFLTILITSGAIKPFFITYILDANITLISLFIVLLDIVYTSKKQVSLDLNKFIFIVLFIIFYTLIILSLAYSKSPSYGYTKTFYFGINLIYFIYPLFLKEIRWRIIFKTLTVIILPLSVWYIVYRYFYWSPEFSYLRLQKIGFYNLTSAYLGIGLFLGLGTLINYFLKFNRFILLIYIITLIFLGARGSLIFTLLILLVDKLSKFWRFLKKNYSLKISTKNTIIFIIIFFSTLPLYITNILKSSVFSYGVMRLKSFFEISKDASSIERLERLTFAVSHSIDNPFSFFFGHGIGSFGIMYVNLDQREYPHNIYFESLFELGVLGLSVIIILTLVPFFLNRPNIYKILFLFLLLSAQKTSSLSDLWVFFFFLGLLIFNTRIKHRQIKKEIT